jgi:hypothetical protein
MHCARFGPGKTHFMPRFSQFSRSAVEQWLAIATLSSFARPFEPPGEIERPTLSNFD